MTDMTTLIPARSRTEADAADPVPVAGVRCQGISKRFPDKTLALDEINLVCPAGELVVLLGPSGCGKTTLLRTIAGLERPTGGQVLIAGEDMTAVEPQRRNLGMVFQDYALYPDKTVQENIGFPLRMAGVPKKTRRERVAAVAKLLEIDHLLARRPSELSGGQRQRVGIGRAIVRNPRVLLMDEPLSNLDAQLRVQLRAEILRVQRALGATTVYVTHDQTEALTLGDRIAVMREGRIEQYGTPEDVFGCPQTTFVARFLGDMNLVGGNDHGHHDAMIGVRPEKLHLGEPAAGDLVLSGNVVLNELLGVERLVHVDTGGGTTVRARVPADAPLGEQLTLFARPVDLHLFDAATGRRRST